MPELFDLKLRAMRRDRAARIGPELFAYERTFADCLERIRLIDRRFGSALLIGCPDPAWPQRLAKLAGKVEIVEPGSLFAQAAGGHQIIEDQWIAPPRSYDLVLAIGTLDTVNELPRALAAIRWSTRDGGLVIGAMAGGDTLPRLRSAMRAADALDGSAAPHVHPRIEPSSLAGLLSAAGFVEPVVDVERMRVSYASLDRLVADLRGMGATNLLIERGHRPLSRSAHAAAVAEFASAADDGRTLETFEVLHFAAWTPEPPKQQ